MLRQHQSRPKLWVYVGVAFLAGVLCSYILLPRGSQSVGMSWQELERRRVENQQILDEGQREMAGKGKHKKKLRAVIGVQVRSLPGPFQGAHWTLFNYTDACVGCPLALLDHPRPFATPQNWSSILVCFLKAMTGKERM